MSDKNPADWTEGDVRRVLTDPIYCLGDTAIISRDEWVKAGVKLIREMGAERYLNMLLDHLESRRGG